MLLRIRCAWGFAVKSHWFAHVASRLPFPLPWSFQRGAAIINEYVCKVVTMTDKMVNTEFAKIDTNQNVTGKWPGEHGQWVLLRIRRAFGLALAGLFCPCCFCLALVLVLVFELGQCQNR